MEIDDARTVDLEPKAYSLVYHHNWNSNRRRHPIGGYAKGLSHDCYILTHPIGLSNCLSASLI